MSEEKLLVEKENEERKQSGNENIKIEAVINKKGNTITYQGKQYKKKIWFILFWILCVFAIILPILSAIIMLAKMGIFIGGIARKAVTGN